MRTSKISFALIIMATTTQAIKISTESQLETKATAMASATADVNAEFELENVPLWEQKLQSMFDVMDESRDDHISKDEFFKVLKD